MSEHNTLSDDFTQGSIVGKLVKFMVPVLGALILQAMYGAVDLLVVGQFGTDAGISAVATGFDGRAFSRIYRQPGAQSGYICDYCSCDGRDGFNQPLPRREAERTDRRRNWRDGLFFCDFYSGYHGPASVSGSRLCITAQCPGTGLRPDGAVRENLRCGDCIRGSL